MKNKRSPPRRDPNSSQSWNKGFSNSESMNKFCSRDTSLDNPRLSKRSLISYNTSQIMLKKLMKEVENAIRAADI